jgi:hypothetical protein
LLFITFRVPQKPDHKDQINPNDDIVDSDGVVILSAKRKSAKPDVYTPEKKLRVQRQTRLSGAAAKDLGDELGEEEEFVDSDEEEEASEDGLSEEEVEPSASSNKKKKQGKGTKKRKPSSQHKDSFAVADTSVMDMFTRLQQQLEAMEIRINAKEEPVACSASSSDAPSLPVRCDGSKPSNLSNDEVLFLIEN